MRRLSSPERKRRLALAQDIARERAKQWWVWSTTTKGERKAQATLVNAAGETQALKKVRRSVAARPSLPSRVWRIIYEEVGL